MPFYGNVGLRIGQLNNIGSTAFGTSALMQSATWTAGGTEKEFRDGTGKIQACNMTPNGHEASFKYYVATNTLTISASIVMPAYGDKFAVTQTGNSGSIVSSTWLTKKVSYEEVIGSENATEVNVDAVDYGF
jgi:hypothetical protein